MSKVLDILFFESVPNKLISDHDQIDMTLGLNVNGSDSNINESNSDATEAVKP